MKLFTNDFTDDLLFTIQTAIIIFIFFNILISNIKSDDKYNNRFIAKETINKKVGANETINGQVKTNEEEANECFKRTRKLYAEKNMLDGKTMTLGMIIDQCRSANQR